MALVLFAAILAIDQLVKLAVKLSMLPGESIPVIDGFFHFTYVLNPGAAFGMLENQQIFFIAAGLMIIAVFIYCYPQIRSQCAYFHYGCVALLAGAVGNLIDRVRTGLVVDYLDFRVWPVFNIADIAIVVGVISMMYAIIYKMKDN